MVGEPLPYVSDLLRPLPRAEHIALFRKLADARAASSSDEAREYENLLVRHNLALVVSIAAKRRGRLSMEDAVAEGTAGLLLGIRKYDPERGVQPSTYLCFWITQSVLRALQADHLIHIPSHHFDKQAPGRAEAVALLGRVDKRLSLHTPLLSGGKTTERVLADIIPDPDADTGHHAEEAEARARVESLLCQLPPRLRLVVAMRSGVGGHDEHTLEEVGDLLGISRERARQLELKALRLLGGDAAVERKRQDCREATAASRERAAAERARDRDRSRKNSERRERVLAELRSGPRTARELAAPLGISTQGVINTIKQLQAQGHEIVAEVVHTADKSTCRGAKSHNRYRLAAVTCS